jgi:hypothetical protein
MPDEVAERSAPRRRLLVALVAAAALAAGLGLVNASDARAGDGNGARRDSRTNAPADGHDCDRERGAAVSV